MEFCVSCGSIMLPIKNEDDIELSCNLCGRKEKWDEEMIDSYIINIKIERPKGE